MILLPCSQTPHVPSSYCARCLGLQADLLYPHTPRPPPPPPLRSAQTPQPPKDPNPTPPQARPPPPSWRRFRCLQRSPAPEAGRPRARLMASLGGASPPRTGTPRRRAPLTAPPFAAAVPRFAGGGREHGDLGGEGARIALHGPATPGSKNPLFSSSGGG